MPFAPLASLPRQDDNYELNRIESNRIESSETLCWNLRLHSGNGLKDVE